MPSNIEHSERLTNIFGRWPDFHDAVILGLRIEVDPQHDPTLEADFHVFEITQNVTDMGYLELLHHTRATVQFTGVEGLKIRGFAQRNELARFDVEPTGDGKLTVHFGSEVGDVLNVSFRCERAAVTATMPFVVSDPVESARQVMDRVRKQRANRRP